MKKSLLCILLCFAMLAISACANSNVSFETDENINNTAVSITEDNVGVQSDKQERIIFTVIDEDTVRATINDPYILARATDLSQIQLKLFKDEATRDQYEGAFAFSLHFFQQEGEGITCNVYPQTCRIEEGDQPEYRFIVDEDILDSDGVPISGACIVEDTKLVFVVKCDGLADIVRQNQYYSTYVDYNEYTRGIIASVADLEYVTPDLSETTISEKVDMTFFDNVYSDYIVVEYDFDNYVSYGDYAWDHQPNPARQNIVETLWLAQSNNEINKSAVLVASIDEFGVANYYIAQVYDSHEELIADYMQEQAINVSLEYETDEEDESLLTEETFQRFLPEDKVDISGVSAYVINDNVIYWKFVPDFNEHYNVYAGYNIPGVKFEYGGYILDGVNEAVLDMLALLVTEDELSTNVIYNYLWCNLSSPTSYYQTSEATLVLTGESYRKTINNHENDDINQSILEEVQRIRNEQGGNNSSEVNELSSDELEEPGLMISMYDDVSADMLLMNVDSSILSSNGYYEVDAGDYTIRLQGSSLDSINCTIGQYVAGKYEILQECDCYRDTEAGTNHVRLNINLDGIEGAGWTSIDDFNFYVVICNERNSIEKEISINRWY